MLECPASSHYYNHPETWQFCLVYSVSTLEAWDQKLVDDIPGIVANLGLQTALFSWIALASSFRALYHHEWIPSTIAFLCYTLFGQLIYYQNSPLILYPATMVTNLVSVAKFFLSDIYGTSMGSFCYNLVYRVPEVCTLTGNFCEFQLIRKKEFDSKLFFIQSFAGEPDKRKKRVLGNSFSTFFTL